MRRLNQFWRKSVCFFLALFFSFSVGVSEAYFSISESELNQMQAETDKMMMKVNELTGSVKRLESQRNEYMTLSSELRLEAEAERKKKEFWRNATITISVSVIAGGVVYYILK
jgi:predicted Holliday junction resolvase-like endonuclease